MGSAGGRTPAPSGLVVVDKPSGWTSHDVVGADASVGRHPAGRARRDARPDGHRRPAHRDRTRDQAARPPRPDRQDLPRDHPARPDDRHRRRRGRGDRCRVSAAGVTDEAIAAGVAALTGAIQQVPSSVSAIKVDGQRSYARVRAGEDVTLPARPVTVARFDVLTIRREGDLVDVDVVVDCSTGTYVRALARDLGVALEVGGHLTALRRTRVGPFGLELAHTLEELETEWSIRFARGRGQRDVCAARPRRGAGAGRGARRATTPRRRGRTDGRLRSGWSSPGADGAQGRCASADGGPGSGLAGRPCAATGKLSPGVWWMCRWGEYNRSYVRSLRHRRCRSRRRRGRPRGACAAGGCLSAGGRRPRAGRGRVGG